MEITAFGSARKVTADDLTVGVANKFMHEEPRLTLRSVGPFEVDLLKMSSIEIRVRLV